MDASREMAVAGCLLLAGAGLLGCGPKPEPTSPQPAHSTLPGEVSEEPSTPWSKCYESFASSGDPETDISALGRACGVANQQKPITAARMGQQSEHDAVDRFTFTAGGPGKCYRVLAVGESAVRDLDVQVFGPDGELIAADTSKNPYPVVPSHEPLCLAQPGIYGVEVSVHRGEGRYAVQVWGN